VTGTETSVVMDVAGVTSVVFREAYPANAPMYMPLRSSESDAFALDEKHIRTNSDIIMEGNKLIF
jgi:hypothetical protein